MLALNQMEYESGKPVKPTIVRGLPAISELADIEISGPVPSLTYVKNMGDAMKFLAR